MTSGRKPNIEPATAYDYRRYLALVQVLAIEDNTQQEKAILALCQGWEVSAVWFNKGTWLNVMATVEALARHAIDYHRKEGASNEA